jgi:hypothetical protein
MSSTARDQTGWVLTTRELRGTAASLATTVVATAADGPFGDVDYVHHFFDGRLVEERLGSLHERDVVVSMTYRAMALVRAGEWSVIEALEGGSVVGDLGPLAALADALTSVQ